MVIRSWLALVMFIGVIYVECIYEFCPYQVIIFILKMFSILVTVSLDIQDTS